MRAVILAAGRGTRMGALTAELSKPMLPILGKPLLEWKFAMLPVAIDEVILIIGYLGDQIMAHFGDTWQGRRIRYVKQSELNGTGGAMLLVKDLADDATLVMMGDDLYHPDDLIHLAALPPGTLAVLGLPVTDVEPFGLLETMPDGHLSKITEKPHGKKDGMINTGAYIIDQSYFDYPPVKHNETEYGLPQTLAALGADIPVRVVQARAWQPIGRPEDIPQGEAFLKKYWEA